MSDRLVLVIKLWRFINSSFALRSEVAK